MRKKLIVIDFDHTIINTTHLIDAIAAMFDAEFGITKQQFLDAREQTMACCLVEDMDTVIEHLSHDDKTALHNALHDTIKQTVSSFVFPDVVDFMERHHNAGFNIVISTHGDTELQSEKIAHCNFPSFVEMLISTKEKADALAPYVEEYDEVHFIDDKAHNLDGVKKAHPSVITYFIKRPQDCKYCHIQSTCNCVDKTIESLDISIS